MSLFVVVVDIVVVVVVVVVIVVVVVVVVAVVVLVLVVAVALLLACTELGSITFSVLYNAEKCCLSVTIIKCEVGDPCRQASHELLGRVDFLCIHSKQWLPCSGSNSIL